MNLKSGYDFKEAGLGPDFAQEKLKEFKGLIDEGSSFVLTSMPGVGASYFLKYLACQNFARSARGARRAFFIHIDLYLLPTLTQHEFYRLLHREVGGKMGPKTDEQVFIETKAHIKNYAQKFGLVVIVFSRFDQLKKELDENFLSNLQSLTTQEPGKIVLIFTSIKPLHELSPEAVVGGNLTFYSKYLYFKPYSDNDLKKLLKIEEVQPVKNVDLEKLIELSGGHYQLLNILLNSQKQQNPSLDQFVRLQLKELVDYLSYYQRKTLQKIALGKHIDEVDEYLLGVGMVKKTTSGYGLFTPLLTEYIKTNMPIKLPAKEAKLFRVLRKSMGSTVSKDEIFTEVWGEGDENATDWALDALIYRLRKHPFIKTHGYIIESQKKVGYTLIQT